MKYDLHTAAEVKFGKALWTALRSCLFDGNIISGYNHIYLEGYFKLAYGKYHVDTATASNGIRWLLDNGIIKQLKLNVQPERRTAWFGSMEGSLIDYDYQVMIDCWSVDKQLQPSNVNVNDGSGYQDTINLALQLIELGQTDIGLELLNSVTTGG